MPAGRSRDGPGQEAMGQQGCRLRAKVIPAAFPSGKTGHISGAMDVNLEWTRISDDLEWRIRPAGPRRGSGDHRNLTTASNPSNLIMPPG